MTIGRSTLSGPRISDTTGSKEVDDDDVEHDAAAVAVLVNDDDDDDGCSASDPCEVVSRTGLTSTLRAARVTLDDTAVLFANAVAVAAAAVAVVVVADDGADGEGKDENDDEVNDE